jgi:hypothetical protein
MDKKLRQNLISFVLVILLFGFQLLAAHYNQIFISHLMYIEYGWESTLPVLATIFFGVLSGMICVYLVRPHHNGENSHPRSFTVGRVVLLCVTLLVLLLKVLMIAGVWMFPFSPLRPVWNEVFHLLVYSQVPSLLLGIVVGGLVIKKWIGHAW